MSASLFLPKDTEQETDSIHGALTLNDSNQYYKLLYKPMAKVMGKGDFRPPTAAEPLNRFL